MCKYSLTLDNDATVLSAAWPANEIDLYVTNELPDGKLADYRFVDGEFVKKSDEEIRRREIDSFRVSNNTVDGEIFCLNGKMYRALENIPATEPIIVGQNVTETTIEEQLAKLREEKES